MPQISAHCRSCVPVLVGLNQPVTTQARVDVFARAPAADLARPLIDLRAARFAHWLQIPAGKAARVYLEDHRGVRYADVHAGGKHPVVFGLVPSAYYFVRSSDGSRELKVELDRKTRIDLDPSRMTRTALASRGAVEQSFRLHLYAEPFDADYYRGFIAAQGTPSVALDAPRWRPGPPDHEVIDTELRRLNHVARTNAALRRRLNDRSLDVVRAIEVGDHEKAAELLRSVETTR